MIVPKFWKTLRDTFTKTKILWSRWLAWKRGFPSIWLLPTCVTSLICFFFFFFQFFQTVYSYSQEIPGVIGKFGLGLQNEAGPRLTEFCQDNTCQQTPSSNNTRKDSEHWHHQLVNTEIRLIIFFAVKDGEALYSQQKQDRELTMAHIMNSLL